MPIRNKQRFSIPHSGPLRGAGPLNVPHIYQEQKNWCWAACAGMVLHYYNSAGVAQCRFANQALGQSSCCQFPNSSICDLPLQDLQITQLFTAYGLKTSYSAKSVGFGTLVSEINSGRPVEVAFSWNGGGGHVALVVETSIINNRQVVRVNDPKNGAGGVYYSDLQNAYGLGKWDATWTSIQP